LKLLEVNAKRERRTKRKLLQISNANTGSAHKQRPLGTGSKGSSVRKDANSNASHCGRKGSVEDTSRAKGDSKEDFDITSLPGCRLLSNQEKKLCASARLRPTQYVTFKTLILKDYAQKRKGSTPVKSTLENIDRSLRRRIVNFMIRSGWITAS